MDLQTLARLLLKAESEIKSDVRRVGICATTRGGYAPILEVFILTKDDKGQVVRTQAFLDPCEDEILLRDALEYLIVKTNRQLIN